MGVELKKAALGLNHTGKDDFPKFIIPLFNAPFKRFKGVLTLT